MLRVAIPRSRLVLSLLMVMAEADYATRDIMQCGSRD
jgi:hypothetical protein